MEKIGNMKLQLTNGSDPNPFRCLVRSVRFCKYAREWEVYCWGVSSKNIPRTAKSGLEDADGHAAYVSISLRTREMLRVAYDVWTYPRRRTLAWEARLGISRV
jgi:hypothetical protein